MPEIITGSAQYEPFSVLSEDIYYQIEQAANSPEDGSIVSLIEEYYLETVPVLMQVCAINKDQAALNAFSQLFEEPSDLSSKINPFLISRETEEWLWMGVDRDKIDLVVEKFIILYIKAGAGIGLDEELTDHAKEKINWWWRNLYATNLFDLPI
jgi:hypothetical protein